MNRPKRYASQRDYSEEDLTTPPKRRTSSPFSSPSSSSSSSVSSSSRAQAPYRFVDLDNEEEEPATSKKRGRPASSPADSKKRVWLWQSRLVLIHYVQKWGPVRRAWNETIKTFRSRHGNGEPFPLFEQDDKSVAAVKSYWATIVTDFKNRKEWVRPLKLTAAETKIINALTGPNANEERKSRAWVAYCAKVESGGPRLGRWC